MVIHANEYILRSFRLDDVDAFYQIAHEEAVKKYVPYAYVETKAEASESVRIYAEGDNKNDFYLLIVKENVPVGVIIATRTIGRVLDVSTLVSKEHRGQGIMTVAMNSFIQYLKKNTDYKTLVMMIRKENVASNKQVLKIGAILETEVGGNNVYHVYLK